MKEHFFYEVTYSVPQPIPADFYPITGDLHHFAFYSLLKQIGISTKEFKRANAKFTSLIIGKNKIIIKTALLPIGNRVVETKTLTLNIKDASFTLKQEKISILSLSELLKPTPILKLTTKTPFLTHVSNIYHPLIYALLHLHKKWNSLIPAFNIKPDQLKMMPKLSYLNLKHKLISIHKKQSYPGVLGSIGLYSTPPGISALLKFAHYTGIGLKRSYGFGAVNVSWRKSPEQRRKD